MNGLELGISEETGALVYLSYPATGVILEATPQSAGFLDLAFPVDSFPAMRLASCFSRARVVKKADELTITYDQLGSSRTNPPLPSGKVSAQIKLQAAADGRSVILTCHIENRSEAPVPQILFPDLHGLQAFDGPERTQLRLPRGVVQPFMVSRRPPHSAPFYVYGSWNDYPAGSYYSQNALRWLDYGGLKGGLSIFQKEWGSRSRPSIFTHRSEADPMTLRLLWEHKTAIEPGQTWHSGEFWLTPHCGGWAKGIEVYRAYVRQVNPARELPRHVREGLGFQTIWMIEQLERDQARAAFRFNDLSRIAKDAMEHGIDELVPWSWCQYSVMPIPLRSELGTQQDLLQGVRRARELGVNVAPFISIQHVLSRDTRRYGVKPSTENWAYHTELIPVFRPYYTKFGDIVRVESDNAVWQKDVLAALEEWINLGMHSFCWDSFSTRFSTKSNEGCKPELIRLIENVRGLARAKDPESTFAGESGGLGSLEHDGSVLDYTWNWVDYVDAGPILNVLSSPRLNCNVEDSPLVVKKAFCDGLYLNVMPRKPDQPNGTALISDQPSLAAALMEVAPLRKRFLPFFVEGTFVGDSALTEVPGGFVRGHLLGNRLLIIALNDQAEPQHITVQSDLALWLPSAKSYQVKSYDSRGNLIEARSREVGHWVGVTRLLQSLELAFFEIQADAPSNSTGEMSK